MELWLAFAMKYIASFLTCLIAIGTEKHDFEH